MKGNVFQTVTESELSPEWWQMSLMSDVFCLCGHKVSPLCPSLIAGRKKLATSNVRSPLNNFLETSDGNTDTSSKQLQASGYLCVARKH